MIRVDIWLPDPVSLLAEGAFGADAVIRLERAATENGSYAEIQTLDILATTVQYLYWDADGDATSWYRWRVSDVGNTLQSDYSLPFQGTSPALTVFPRSYATIDQALALWETAPPASKLARLGSLLGTATDQVIDEFRGRDYFRHPSSGTETWTLDVPREADVLHCHDGLISLSLVELSWDGGATFTEIDDADWVLRGQNPRSDERIPTGEPYFHVVFTGHGTHRHFSRGVAAVRLTGARGWATIPTVLVEATAQRARQLMEAEASYSGSDAGGLDQMGRPPTTDRFWPQTMWNFLKTERDRFRVCVTATGRPLHHGIHWGYWPWSQW